jgi:alpha-1,3-fucosyltransferase 10
LATSKRPLVLFRTPYFRGPVQLERIPAELRPHFTADQSRLAEADAVVFHIPDWKRAQLEDTPKYPGQVWIAWSLESAANYPRLADPSFMRHFELRLTYEASADIRALYLPDREHWESVRSAPLPVKDEAAPLVMFQSALVDACGRNAFAASLMRLMRVDSYGRVARNRTLPDDRGRSSKLATIARYRFCLSLENSIERDYVTEKLFDPLIAGTVPVYRGAPNAAEYAPEHSYIDAEAYGGPRGLAEYLTHLIKNPEEYAAYFKWRDNPLPPSVSEKLEANAKPMGVKIIDRLTADGTARRPGAVSLPFGLIAALSARGSRLSRRLTGRSQPWRTELLTP